MKKFNLSKYWVEIGLIAVSLLVHLYIALRPGDSLMNWYTSDDGFYYFKVAVNIARGLGATFDGISRTNGFHPLWMLVCIPVFWLAKFDLLLPLRVLVMVSAAINTGTALLIFHLMRKFISFQTAAAMAVIWTFLPSVHLVVVQMGMESAISAFFLTLLLFLAVRWRERTLTWGKSVLMGVIAGLAILARLDNIFVVMLLGVWFVLGQTSGYLRAIVLGDLAFIFIAGLLGYYFRLPAGLEYIENSVSLPWQLVLSYLLIPLFLLFFGLYRSAVEKITWKYLARCVLAVGLPSILIGLVLIALKGLGKLSALPRLAILLAMAGMLLGIIGIRLVATIIYKNESTSNIEDLRSWGFFKGLIPRAAGYFFPAGLLLGIYMLWSYWYVGIPMPISGTIKHWWGTLPNTVYGSAHHTILELFGLAGRTNAWGLALSSKGFFQGLLGRILAASPALAAAQVFTYLLVILALVVIVLQYKWFVSVIQKLGLFAVLLGLYVQILDYTSTSYLHVRSWYWVGQLLFTVLAMGLLLEALLMTLKRFKIKKYVWPAAMIAICVYVGMSFTSMVAKYFPLYDPVDSQQGYLADIHGLENATEPGAILGSTGGGTAGYFIQDRTVVNLDGLINSPEYFDMLKVGKGDLFLDKIGLQYVFGTESVITQSDPYMELFKNHLQKMDFSGEIALFRYNLTK